MFRCIFDSFRSAFVYTSSMAAHDFSGRGLVMISFKFFASGSVPVIFLSLGDSDVENSRPYILVNMTSSANKMQIFLWQVATVIPVKTSC